MKLEKVSQEFAKDYIKLINSLKGLTYDGHVDYSTKSGQIKKFDYVTLDKIYNELKKNDDFAVVEPLGTDDMGQSALQVLLIHKTGELLISDYYALRIPIDGSKQDEGSAITYTKRYALGSFLGISTDEDNDANPQGEGMPIKKELNKMSLATEKQIELIKSKLSEEEINKALNIVKKPNLESLTVTEASSLIKNMGGNK